MTEPLLRLEGLSVVFHTRVPGLVRRQPFAAVKNIDLEIAAGEAMALVGESGSGKSTIARSVVGLQKPTSGTMTFEGEDLDPMGRRDQRRAIQMVFQDPRSSLNSRLTIGNTITEVLKVHKLAHTRAAARARAVELIEMVGMPASALDRRPRSFSGGQRQRLAIARALALEPRLLVADEPVSALDVSVQASILLLLKRLQRELGLTMLFISHDLAVVRQLCDRVAVMSAGEIVERGEVDDILDRPQHPFTRELVGSATELPPLDPRLPVVAG